MKERVSNKMVLLTLESLESLLLVWSPSRRTLLTKNPVLHPKHNTVICRILRRADKAHTLMNLLCAAYFLSVLFLSSATSYTRLMKVGGGEADCIALAG